MQVTCLTVYVPLGHPFSANDLPLEGLADRVRRDLYKMIVQVVDAFLEPEKRLLQSHREVHEEVISHTLELLVLLLLHGENEVSLDHVRDLFGLTFEHKLISIFHALLDLNAEGLDIIHDLAALAMRAVRSIGLPSSTTAVTVSLHLHLHSESHLHFLHDNALTIAFRAHLGLAVLSSSAATLLAVDVPGY